MVFGEVVWAAVDEAVLRDDRPAIDLLRPLARLGADEWSTIGEVVDRTGAAAELADRDVAERR